MCGCKWARWPGSGVGLTVCDRRCPSARVLRRVCKTEVCSPAESLGVGYFCMACVRGCKRPVLCACDCVACHVISVCVGLARGRQPALLPCVQFVTVIADAPCSIVSMYVPSAASHFVCVCMFAVHGASRGVFVRVFVAECINRGKRHFII